MEGEGVEPDAIASSSQSVFFFIGQQAPRGTVSAFPFLAWVYDSPLIRGFSDLDYLLEQSKRLWWSWAREMRDLAFVVGDDADGVRERAVLRFGGLVEGGQVGSGEDGVKVLAGRGKG